MDRYLVHGLVAAGATILVLVLLELFYPAHHTELGPDESDPQVWAVLDEARRITQAAAESQE